MQDRIVEEIHKIREAIANRFGNDLHAICDDARRRQAISNRNIVDLSDSKAKPPSETPKKVG